MNTVQPTGTVEAFSCNFNVGGGTADIAFNTSGSTPAVLSVSTNITDTTPPNGVAGVAELSSFGSGTASALLNLSNSMVNVTVSPTQTLMIATQISNGGLTLANGGMVELLGTNSYAMGTTITSGTTVMATAPLRTGVRLVLLLLFPVADLCSFAVIHRTSPLPYFLTATASSATVSLNVTTNASSGVAVGTFNIDGLSLNSGNTLF